MRLKQPGKVSTILAAVILIGTGIIKSLSRSGVELPEELLTAALVVLGLVGLAYLIFVFREGKNNGQKP